MIAVVTPGYRFGLSFILTQHTAWAKRSTCPMLSLHRSLMVTVAVMQHLAPSYLQFKKNLNRFSHSVSQ